MNTTTAPHLSPASASEQLPAAQRQLPVAKPQLPATTGSNDQPADAAALSWLRSLVESRSQTQAAAICGISPTTISRLLAGTYNGDRAKMLARVRQSMDNEISRSALAGNRGFFETSLSRAVWQQCEFTRIFGSLNRIIGHSQIGKTTALDAYQRAHVDTTLITLNTGITLAGIIRKLAAALGCHAHPYTDAALDTFAPLLTRNSLIIIDEAHQVASRPAGVQVMEFLRALYDRCHCGVLLCGTYLLDAWLREGRAAATMEQLIKRGTTCYLNSYATRADLAALAANYNMPPLSEGAMRYATSIVAASGFGEFCKMLERAVYVAHQHQRAATWEFALAVMDEHAHQAELYRHDRK